MVDKKNPNRDMDKLEDSIKDIWNPEKATSEEELKKAELLAEREKLQKDLEELLVEEWVPEEESDALTEQINSISEKYRINPKVVRAILHSQLANLPHTASGDVGDEITSLEDMVQEALTDFTDIDSNLLDIITPSGTIGSGGKSLMLVRRFQNSMQESLTNGVAKKDMDIFLEAFDFFDSAIDILTSTGNQEEIDQVKTELVNDLKKLLEKLDITDPSLRPFAFKACKVLAETYDSFEQFSSALHFHNRAGNLHENDLVAHMEYIQVVFDYLLIDEIDEAKSYMENMRLKSLKTLASQLIDAITEKDLEIIAKIKARIKEMGLKRSLDVKNPITLIDMIKSAIEGVGKSTGLELVRIPAAPTAVGSLSSDKLDALVKSIKQLQANQPNVKVPAAQVDTAGLISELKSAFSSELNREIKSLSRDIVIKLLSKLPTGVGSSTPLRSAGHISDADRPAIEIVGAVKGEKPKRPKLDDMLDSIVVSD